MYRRLSIDVFFATLLQRRGMVERRRDVKTITLQRLYDVVCLLEAAEIVEGVLKYGRNLTKSTKFKPLLTMPSVSVFVLTNYG